MEKCFPLTIEIRDIMHYAAVGNVMSPVRILYGPILVSSWTKYVSYRALADPGLSFGGQVERRRREYRGAAMEEGAVPRKFLDFFCLGRVHFACILSHD